MNKIDISSLKLIPDAIEQGFPYIQVSQIAAMESWRKEVYRPIYHIHKWWAQRLGSVFRAMILSAAGVPSEHVMDAFYSPVNFKGLTVFDPFMGSGTTIGEALKLGCFGIGQDINPVSHRIVKTELESIDRRAVLEAFANLEQNIGLRLKKLYTTKYNGGTAEVLYYFWVKQLPCSACGSKMDMFSNYVFSRHAYAKKNPTGRILCPSCSEIIQDRYDATEIICTNCQTKFNPQVGPVNKDRIRCLSCNTEHKVAALIKHAQTPPGHRMYAKMILTAEGRKLYLPITDYDRQQYMECTSALSAEGFFVPRVKLSSGFNTNQTMNYGYSHWHQFFNNRQLFGLSLLANAISEIEDESVRDALAVVFSGVLEFNNMFASFKGEGTGAVRHMFSHHILKPERTPLEANIWGTPKSSGAFSTLFKTRLLRALDYKEHPFEIAVDRSSKKTTARKVHVLGGLNLLDVQLVREFDKRKPKHVHLSCGDSSKTHIPSGSVDLVITDPPFFRVNLTISGRVRGPVQKKVELFIFCSLLN